MVLGSSTSLPQSACFVSRSPPVSDMIVGAALRFGDRIRSTADLAHYTPGPVRGGPEGEPFMRRCFAAARYVPTELVHMIFI